MKNLMLLILSFFTLIPFGTKAQNAAHPQEKQYVLLVSFDGFRNDYPEKFNLPLNRF
ncbi:hypothetical protein [Bergeyella cardium]|uniref:Uncharacterized protein n=1 Tax=Bergeyella cardium TaxID=1585976 RepID=A0A6P1QUX5_9FLAO|nr:hypothetical protein [Bergeyella cardium]QHN65619.1 hypothetical protein DBX24_06870 [Bergeyella cardium]WHE33207.1 hypothetical protein P8603_06910 [Bergeyella cardium]WHF59857.1 hypothetical protein O0R51_06910 [Bergeyella cardium]